MIEETTLETASYETVHENESPSRPKVMAFGYNEHLIIYASAISSGFGASIRVTQSPLMIFPPIFLVEVLPGNMGINQDAGPDNVPVSGAFGFKGGALSEIFIEDEFGRRTIRVIKVEEGEISGFDNDEDDEHEELNVPPDQWRARQDFRNIPSRVRVEGRPIMPQTGYILKLTRQVPQGINIRQLILNLEVTAPEIGGDALTPTFTSYTERSEHEYDSILVVPNDGSENFEIEVEKVQ
ncbi:MAG: hypothetical protein M3209_13855 [Acidobacteriota bacterium]|nr:hypothetical protein [Acidobacteriota bacterium]